MYATASHGDVIIEEYAAMKPNAFDNPGSSPSSASEGDMGILEKNQAAIVCSRRGTTVRFRVGVGMESRRLSESDTLPENFAMGSRWLLSRDGRHLQESIRPVLHGSPYQALITKSFRNDASARNELCIGQGRAYFFR